MDPIRIVLLKLIQAKIPNLKVGGPGPPRKNVG